MALVPICTNTDKCRAIAPSPNLGEAQERDYRMTLCRPLAPRGRPVHFKEGRICFLPLSVTQEGGKGRALQIARAAKPTVVVSQQLYLSTHLSGLRQAMPL